MANSREAQFPRDITKAMSALGLTSVSDGRSGKPTTPKSSAWLRSSTVSNVRKR